MSVDLEVSEHLVVLSAIAEPTRWRIVQLLRDEELCVCHLVEALALPQPLVSHHLGVLRHAGVVTTERFRYWTYYRLDRDVLAAAAARVSDVLPGAGGGRPRRRPCG